MPICSRMGDIIRVHRATVSIPIRTNLSQVDSFKGVKNFKANLGFNSTWVLFPLMPRADEEEEHKDDPDYSPAPDSTSDEEAKTLPISHEFTPRAFFKKTFTFEKSEQKLLRTLRTWAQTSFENYTMVPKKWIKPLNEVAKIAEGGKLYDFDLICKVVQICRIDEYCSELRLLDGSGEVWFCQGYTGRFRYIWEGVYIRIRAASLENTHKLQNTISLKQHSNILLLPYPCKLAQEMELVEGYKALTQLDASTLKAAKFEHPVIATEITDEKLKNKKISNFDRIAACKKEGEIFKARFRILAACNDVSGMVKTFNQKTWYAGRAHDAKDYQQLVYQTQFYIEDARNSKNKLNTLLLYSHAGHGLDFF